MTTRLAGALTAIDHATPAIVLALTAGALVLTVLWAVDRTRSRREAFLRDLELGIPRVPRRIPLWMHALVGFAGGEVLGAAIMLPWMPLAAGHAGLPATAVIPGMVGSNTIVAALTTLFYIGAVAVRRRWAAKTDAVRAAGDAFRIRSATARLQLSREDG